MAGSMAGFAFNDAAIKLGAADIGIYQAIFVRGVFASLLIGLFAWRMGAFKILPNSTDLRWIALRTLTELGATFCFLTALLHMPIANVTAILQALPLTVSLAAVWLLNETIGWRRAGAIFIGLVGVMLIIKPGTEGFNSYAILAMVAVVFITFRDLIVRQFSDQVSTLFVSFVTAIAITFAGAIALIITHSWQPMTSQTLLLLMLASVLIFVGYYCSVAAMRFGEVAIVAPFRYSIMIWAILLGWIIWDETPDYLTLIGMVIVVSMGVYTFWRERGRL
ncbi:membrane protein [Amylibacter ulvae]|uniref:Membrane protein n=2 Tax=Paramylibacter ulvae TaxID=1651968 RepID=A0ABQ3D5R6_9RHOB|nr:membrane protein [Amylibacter ulvae]